MTKPNPNRKYARFSINQTKAIIILVVVSILLTVMVVPTSYKVSGSNTISLHVARPFDDRLPVGQKFVIVSNQTMLSFPTLLNATAEADKLHDNLVAMCNGNCAHLAGLLPPNSYGAQISLNEAQLAITNLGFVNTSIPNSNYPPMHSMWIEYHGKYYVIGIIGI